MLPSRRRGAPWMREGLEWLRHAGPSLAGATPLMVRNAMPFGPDGLLARQGIGQPNKSQQYSGIIGLQRVERLKWIPETSLSRERTGACAGLGTHLTSMPKRRCHGTPFPHRGGVPFRIQRALEFSNAWESNQFNPSGVPSDFPQGEFPRNAQDHSFFHLLARSLT